MAQQRSEIYQEAAAAGLLMLFGYTAPKLKQRFKQFKRNRELRFEKKINDAIYSYYEGETDPFITTMLEDAIAKNETNKLKQLLGFEKKSSQPSGNSYEAECDNKLADKDQKVQPYENVVFLKTEKERRPYLVTVKKGSLQTKQLGTLAGVNEEIIFIMDKNGQIYAGVQDIYRFHHSSFLAGEKVVTAGHFEFINDVLEISNNSGHYTPDYKSLTEIITELTTRGFDIKKIRIKKH